MNSKKELKKRISADYERRVKQWMASDPSQLIDAAEEITVARLIRDNIEDAITEEDANFLLELDDPLDDLTARWIAENGLEASHSEELLRCVWTLREDQTNTAVPCTVHAFLSTHPGSVFSLMTALRVCTPDRFSGRRASERPRGCRTSRSLRHRDGTLRR